MRAPFLQGIAVACVGVSYLESQLFDDDLKPRVTTLHSHPSFRSKEDARRHGWCLGLLFYTPVRCLRGLLLAWSGAAAAMVAWSGESYAKSAAAAAELLTWRRLLGALFTRESACPTPAWSRAAYCVQHIACTSCTVPSLFPSTAVQLYHSKAARHLLSHLPV
jgi:hypothetical protein